MEGGRSSSREASSEGHSKKWRFRQRCPALLELDVTPTGNVGVLLKRDVFSTVERGRFRDGDESIEAVLRRIDDVPWWSWAVAWLLFRRERAAWLPLVQLRSAHVPRVRRAR